MFPLVAPGKKWKSDSVDKNQLKGLRQTVEYVYMWNSIQVTIRVFESASTENEKHLIQIFDLCPQVWVRVQVRPLNHITY